MGAFKIRGAFNMIAQLSAEQLKRGVITYSSGNHGQAVAMAAQLLGAPAVIVMPTTAPKVKVEGAKSYGAEVQFAGTTSTDRQRQAEAEAARAGADHRAAVRSSAASSPGRAPRGSRSSSSAPKSGPSTCRWVAEGCWLGVAAAVKLSKPSVRVIGGGARGRARP